MARILVLVWLRQEHYRIEQLALKHLQYRWPGYREPAVL